MKTTSIFLSFLIITSCTVVQTVSPSGGKATFASLGGDSQNIVISSEGAQIASNNNSVAFGKAANTASIMTGTLALASVAKTSLQETGLTDRSGIAAGTTRNANNVSAATTQTISNNSTSVNLAKIQADKAINLKALDVPPTTVGP